MTLAQLMLLAEEEAVQQKKADEAVKRAGAQRG